MINLNKYYFKAFHLPFFLNIDESGYCDWVNANDIKVIVPLEYDHDEIVIPVNMCSK